MLFYTYIPIYSRLQGGTDVNVMLFIRYLFDFSIFFPTALLCIAPVRDHLKSPKRSPLIALGVVAVCWLAFSVIGAAFGINSNMLLWWEMLLAFCLYRRALRDSFSFGQPAFAFTTSTMVISMCRMLAVVINARAELNNPDNVYLLSTSMLSLGLSAALSALYYSTTVSWIRWLLNQFDEERLWRTVWVWPMALTALFIFILPQDPATVLVNRMQKISVLVILASFISVFLQLYQYYRIARECTLNLHLTQENQMLAVESRRYTELRTYMEQTRHLRHDFRQHMRVISGLTESGNLDALKVYLRQYESEIGDAPTLLCSNPAVDAIAGYYALWAANKQIPIHWSLNLPDQLPLPEADLCMLLGNLLENALLASESLPPEQRDVSVVCQMLSPAMLGLIVENRYDGVLKRHGDTLYSTRHSGCGTGLISVKSAVRKYNGQLTLDTENQTFRVHILLNL